MVERKGKAKVEPVAKVMSLSKKVSKMAMEKVKIKKRMENQTLITWMKTIKLSTCLRIHSMNTTRLLIRFMMKSQNNQKC